MKKERYKIFIGFLLGFCLCLCIFLTNCGDYFAPSITNGCPNFDPNDTTYHFIPSNDTSTILYTGYEKLLFQRTKNGSITDTIKFKGSGKIVSFSSYIDECHNDRFEVQLMNFQSIDNSTYKNISFKLERYDEYSTKFYVSFRSIMFGGSVDRINGWFLKEGVNYFSDIEFNNNSYSKVLYFPEDGKSRTGLESNDPKLFYTKREGIIRIEVDSTEVWDLIP